MVSSVIRKRMEELSIPEPNSGCLLWTGPVSRRGYGKIEVLGVVFAAHRLAYDLFRGPISEGLFVCHKCDVPACIEPAHLFLGTHADNMRDMTEKGRRGYLPGRPFSRRGELRPRTYRRGKNGLAGSIKLDAAAVLAIRADSRSIRTIAKDYGVAHSTVGQIKRREIWSQVEASDA